MKRSISSDNDRDDKSEWSLAWRVHLYDRRCVGRSSHHHFADTCRLSSIALVPRATERSWALLGVTVSLNVNTLNPAKLDAILHIHNRVIRQGKRLAVIDTVITNAANGEIVATSTHTKADNTPPPSKM